MPAEDSRGERPDRVHAFGIRGVDLVQTAIARGSVVLARHCPLAIFGFLGHAAERGQKKGCDTHDCQAAIRMSSRHRGLRIKEAASSSQKLSERNADSV